MEITKARYKQNMRIERRSVAKKFGLIFAACLLVFSSGGYTYAALSKPLPAVQAVTVDFETIHDQEIALPWPVTGQAAIGSVEQGVVASSNTEEKTMPIASMTKIMTALAVLSKTPLEPDQQGPIYTLDATDTASYRDYLARQGSVVPVNEGQPMSQYQALEYLLVVSANNLADSLVRWNFGGMESYLLYANNLAKEYGLENTVIADASGFAPTTVSTPTDLIKLGTKALANPVIASIVSKATVDLPGYGPVNNSNQLLKESGVIGIKTGTTDEAGRCLLFAANHVIDEGHSVTIVGVVMGMPSNTALYNAARSLLAESKKGFGEMTVVDAGTKVGTYTTPWGASSDIVTKESLMNYGWLGTVPGHEVTMSQAGTPLQAGQEIGTIALDNTEKSSVSVVTKSVVGVPTTLWRLKNYF